MNCECIKTVKERFRETKNLQGRQISDVSFLDMSFIIKEDNSIDTSTHSTVEVKLEGLKKPKKIVVAHTFCPFCGTKIKSK